ncbi:hypothetical protein BVG19_g2317 [[Candida] boidinii]|nr:hypothetical protein BVG19_g2317 [[Candida] boidinii]OWB48899.1 hypothetical protein B5S27_g436 [[Candida] boidinii]OWB82195.1 hypothetical protein B5S33_g817 [[Candida] boidinii]
MARIKKSSKGTGQSGEISSNTNKSFEFPKSLNNLYLENLPIYNLPSYEYTVKDQIITINRFFSREICNELINKILKDEIIRFETTPLIKSKDYAARVNDRISLTDYNTSSNLWKYLQKILVEQDHSDDIYLASDETALNNENGNVENSVDWIKESFKSAKDLNPQLRLYRYQKGHYFGKHYDESVSVVLKDGKRGRTKWTLLIYLTGDDEFEGGGTIFYEMNNHKKFKNVHPSKGMALLHKHGNDCLLHEAEIVKSGEKWVLRSDVVF